MSNIQSNNPQKRRYLFSLIMMMIGGIVAIVGLCVSVEWMIGVGIGIICIASTITYSIINSAQRDGRHTHRRRRHSYYQR